MKKQFLAACIVFLGVMTANAQSLHEAKTNLYFESIKSNPQKLTTFLHNMPKGADLHVHQSGATYAERLLSYAKGDALCINRSTYVTYVDAACPAEDLLMTAIKNQSFYDQVIDAWSMRHFETSNESGHDHFFATFGKYDAITKNHQAEVLAEITARAEREHELYIEIMSTLDGREAKELGKALGFDPDFDRMREKLLASNFDQIIQHISENIDKNEAARRAVLECDKNPKNDGCHIKQRYLYQALREQAPEMVFAQLLAGFESASKDARVVGINIVQPEDGVISMRDYKLQMEMIGYFHQLYPNVNISLHAGELNKDLVSAEGLSFHINDAVNVAKANRIGHGVDISYENNSNALLDEMAKNHVLVEINLSSNAGILGVEGKAHPLPLYMKSGVPVTLSTDDEAVSRSNLTLEYKKAVETFHFSYLTLKQFSRNSLTYGFLPGMNLWQDDQYTKVAADCAHDVIGSRVTSKLCRAFLNENEKAATQWQLENRFEAFERNI